MSFFARNFNSHFVYSTSPKVSARIDILVASSSGDFVPFQEVDFGWTNDRIVDELDWQRFVTNVVCFISSLISFVILGIAFNVFRLFRNSFRPEGMVTFDNMSLKRLKKCDEK